MNRPKLIIVIVILLLCGLSISNFLPHFLSPLGVTASTTKVNSKPVVLMSPIPAGFVPALVTRVVDGDTIEVSLNSQLQKVRFLGMNTPETVDPRRLVQCFGKEASEENKKLLTGKTILMEKDISETDKYDRLLRYIYLPDSGGNLLFVNDYLVREGFAQIDTFPPDVKYVQRLTQAQTEARENNRGLWSKCGGKI